MQLSFLTCLFRVIKAFPAHHSCFVGLLAGFRRCFSISDLPELDYELPKGLFVPVDVSVDHLHYMLIDHQITFVLVRFQRDHFPACVGHGSVLVDNSLAFGNLMHMILNHMICIRSSIKELLVIVLDSCQLFRIYRGDITVNCWHPHGPRFLRLVFVVVACRAWYSIVFLVN